VLLKFLFAPSSAYTYQYVYVPREVARARSEFRLSCWS
jgi:hypothetical protein